MVAYKCDSSLLKIWTMLRSDSESSNLNTYVPAGKTWALGPGISTGALKLTVVFLFHTCADAVPESIMQTAAIPTANTTARLILFNRFRANITNSSLLRTRMRQMTRLSSGDLESDWRIPSLLSA